MAGKPQEIEYVTESMRMGTGYDIQDQAFLRLGDKLRPQFDALQTSGAIRRFAQENKGILTEEEYKEFISYANLIGILMGFQDENEAAV